MEVNFRKLYQKVNQGEWCNAIIGYSNFPLKFETKEDGFYCTEQHCRLIIDLWIVVLRFDWNSNKNIKLK